MARKDYLVIQDLEKTMATAWDKAVRFLVKTVEVAKKEGGRPKAKREGARPKT
jgi:hypothetical protein